MTPEEKLRQMLKDYDRAENDGAEVGEHLRDEDFICLIENKSSSETKIALEENASSAIAADKFAPPRRHLANCDSCLDRFNDFYAFFAPAEIGEKVAAKNEIDAAWQSFAPRIVEKKQQPKFWARIFPSIKKPDYFAAFGWGFAAMLLVFTGIAAFVVWQTKNDNSQLAAQLEQQKQLSEDRLKMLGQSAQNSNDDDEKSKLLAEKAELQNKIAQLQAEIERAAQQKNTRGEILPTQKPINPAQDNPDNSLVAVNTPIYDVFPSDAVVRSGEQSANKLVVPNGAKFVVLILNAAGRAEFAVSNASLTNNTGKIVWRGGGLRKDVTGNFTLTLSRAALKNGNYRLKLSGKDQSGAQAAIEYPLVVEIGK